MATTNPFITLIGAERVSDIAIGLGWILALFVFFEILALLGVSIYIRQTGVPIKESRELYQAASLSAFLTLAVVLTVYAVRV
jgi:hypothetical protein